MINTKENLKLMSKVTKVLHNKVTTKITKYISPLKLLPNGNFIYILEDLDDDYIVTPYDFYTLICDYYKKIDKDIAIHIVNNNSILVYEKYTNLLNTEEAVLNLTYKDNIEMIEGLFEVLKYF